METPIPTPACPSTPRARRQFFTVGGDTLMSPRTRALVVELSRARAACKIEAETRVRLEATLQARADRIAQLERELRQREAEIQRMRQEWVPRRVMDALIQIDGAKVREYAS